MTIREAIVRFRELHQEFKAGAFKSPDARKFYESERDDFFAALVTAQQLGLRPGQSPRQSLRLTREERLVVILGPRREGTLTLDLGIGGFAALVGPLAAHITCDFELGAPPDVLRGKARVVASVKQPDGSVRTSFQILSMPPEDKQKLETLVVDAVLESLPMR